MYPQEMTTKRQIFSHYNNHVSKDASDDVWDDIGCL